MTLRQLASTALLLLLSTSAWAQMGRTDDRLIPYQGHLDLNGGPVTGAYDFRFALFSTATPSAACLGTSGCDGTSLYWTEHLGVTVSGGTFAVVLGEKKALTDAVLANPDLYLAIAVRRAGDPYTVLQGTQRILAVPFAARAAAAKDYQVTGSVYVLEDVWAGGALSANSVTTESLAVHTNVLSANGASGRVGIGTATPAETLEVKGKVKAQGMWTLVDSVTLSADAATLTLSGIPASYGMLKIFFKASSTSPTHTNLRVRFNNDSGATSYGWAGLWDGNSAYGLESSGVLETLSRAASPIAWTVGEGVGTNVVGEEKSFIFHTGVHLPTVFANVRAGQLLWRNSASQVSSMTVFSETGNLRAGTRLMVWGME